MKNIIVPVDFSIQSENALKAAVSLAKKHNSKIFALHMLELNQAYITGAEGAHPEQTVFLLKLAEKRFSDFLNKPYLKDVEVKPIIKHFKVFSEVNEVAEANDADMIIMGSHGTDGIMEIFVGSNTEKVVRNSEVPVLVVKHRLDDFTPKTMVFACDLKEENINAYQRAKYIADQFSVTLHIVYINTPGDNFLSTEDITAKIDKFSSLVGPDFIDVKIYNDYTVEMGVINYAESQGIDIIGIPTHGRKGISHFFMGSIGEDVANHSTIPVVTFKI
ncbi:universal stress protein [Cellulophaga baltica]|uniref:Nucleotide-binding universal stress protein, UspA family n=2 Tax=Cellulophaga baltica TaxID=76594 RepID=A0A1G7D5A4_9FLAO|nr:universal stress protein [Cellulophaga baltica]AIY12992.1 universal stress protein UspA [Cellulophaga baltica NN016038]AIZ41360.1 universal stress protein UspA [Cellulophaga baltica 18]MBA6313468.1 universal stress protein [Cellulophaga baltica]SDE46136.1 Nucleotide-binding universal stress protein, UspA family [Cellulophaga baltica]